ncbi:hypothetical protein K501DRAFT_188374 [Backusella circina FSU 941]|nr:hypothetical protein K501DRAFT_188374 [Backusella circina FSU 941]
MIQNASTVPVHAYSANSTYQVAISVVMYPAVGGFPSAWEFTLIIVVALLAISFLASVGMHWHLWRIRRRQRALFESGLLDTNNSATAVPQANRKLIDPISLDNFPTRIIGDEPSTGLTRVGSTRSTRSIKALENAECLCAGDKQDKMGDEGCVICLDEFSDGEKVRRLPCGHEYHCECIGKRILKKKKDDRVICLFI